MFGNQSRESCHARIGKSTTRCLPPNAHDVLQRPPGEPSRAELCGKSLFSAYLSPQENLLVPFWCIVRPRTLLSGAKGAILLASYATSENLRDASRGVSSRSRSASCNLVWGKWNRPHESRLILLLPSPAIGSCKSCVTRMWCHVHRVSSPKSTGTPSRPRNLSACLSVFVSYFQLHLARCGLVVSPPIFRAGSLPTHRLSPVWGVLAAPVTYLSEKLLV